MFFRTEFYILLTSTTPYVLILANNLGLILKMIYLGIWIPLPVKYSAAPVYLALGPPSTFAQVVVGNHSRGKIFKIENQIR